MTPGQRCEFVTAVIGKSNCCGRITCVCAAGGGLHWPIPCCPVSHRPFTCVTLAGLPSARVCIARTFPAELSQQEVLQWGRPVFRVT